MYKVIIVDDEKLLRQGFIHMIDWSEYGFEIIGDASNGIEALELVERLNPDIVVTDIRMPVMDGIELTKILKEKYEHIQIIILSSYNDFGYVKETLQIGAIDYILKPKMQYTDLVAAMEKAKLHTHKTLQAKNVVQHVLKEIICGDLQTKDLQQKLEDNQISLFSNDLCLMLIHIEPRRLLVSETDRDDKSVVEALMEARLNPKDISFDIGRLLDHCNKVYEEAWKKEITAQQPDLQRIIPHMLVHKARENVDLRFNVGTAEQILMVTLGTTVASVLALAAGWHTLTWAILTVFPPMAIFVAALTVATGFLTKESALKQRKKQIDDSVNQYYHYFLTYLDVMKLKELGNKSLREHIVESGETIIGKTVTQWETALLGGLKIDHYRQLNAAFSRHLLYTRECLDQLA